MQHNPAACIRARDIGGTEKSRERYVLSGIKADTPLTENALPSAYATT